MAFCLALNTEKILCGVWDTASNIWKYFSEGNKRNILIKKWKNFHAILFINKLSRENFFQSQEVSQGSYFK